MAVVSVFVHVLVATAGEVKHITSCFQTFPWKKFKAALINMCNVKGAAKSDEP